MAKRKPEKCYIVTHELRATSITDALKKSRQREPDEIYLKSELTDTWAIGFGAKFPDDDE